MSLQIPIGLSTTGAAERGLSRAVIPLGIAGITTTQVLTGPDARQTHVLRAIAAAAALAAPRTALRLIKLVKDEPGAVVQEKSEVVKGLMDVVRDAMDERPQNLTPSGEQKAAAAALGADAVLVAVAAAELGRLDEEDRQRGNDGSSPTPSEAALAWVVTLQPELLERAVRSGLGARLLELPSRATTILALRKELARLDERVKRLEGNLKTAT